jgi:hypothetical protein
MSITVKDVKEIIEDEIQSVQGDQKTRQVLRNLLNRIDEADNVKVDDLNQLIDKLNQDDLNNQKRIQDQGNEIQKRYRHNSL